MTDVQFKCACSEPAAWFAKVRTTDKSEREPFPRFAVAACDQHLAESLRGMEGAYVERMGPLAEHEIVIRQEISDNSSGRN